MESSTCLNRFYVGLIVLATVAMACFIGCILAGLIEIAPWRFLAFMLALVIIFLPTMVCAILASRMCKRINAGFLFRWFVASACATILIFDSTIEGFANSDYHDEPPMKIPGGDFVDRWVCDPFASLGYSVALSPGKNFIKALPHPVRTPAALAIFLVMPVLCWGLIIEALLNANRIPRVLILPGIIAWAIWIAFPLSPSGTLPATYPETRAFWEIVEKWTALMLFVLLLTRWSRSTIVRSRLVPALV